MQCFAILFSREKVGHFARLADTPAQTERHCVRRQVSNLLTQPNSQYFSFQNTWLFNVQCLLATWSSSGCWYPNPAGSVVLEGFPELRSSRWQCCHATKLPRHPTCRVVFEVKLQADYLCVWHFKDSAFVSFVYNISNLQNGQHLIIWCKILQNRKGGWWSVATIYQHNCCKGSWPFFSMQHMLPHSCPLCPFLQISTLIAVPLRIMNQTNDIFLYLHILLPQNCPLCLFSTLP